MIFFSLIILALIQGLTEFLPVSSSGHLVLVHAFLGGAQDWDSRVVLDMAVHVGTLFSVLVYFWRDVWKMLLGFVGWFKGDFKSDGSFLNLYVLVASIPVIIIGFIVHMIKPEFLLLVEVMAWSTIVFGIVLWLSDRSDIKYNSIEDMNLKNALIIGFAQALALIPGTSRSGITMSAARFLGYSRSTAAQFSLLLAIVAISGGGVLAGKDVLDSGDFELGLDALIACGFSFIAGLISIALMMKWLEKSSFTIFVVYRLILGSTLLLAIYSGVLSL